MMLPTKNNTQFNGMPQELESPYDVIEIMEAIPSCNTYVETDDVNSFVSYDIIELSAVRYTLVAIHAVAIILAAVGNGSVVYFIVRYRRLSATDLLVLNLAACDLIGATIHQPMRLVELLLPFFQQNEAVRITETYCRLTGFLSTFSSAVGIHTVLTISQERFLLICLPLQAKGLITARRTVKVILAIWLISFCAILPLPVLFTYIARVRLQGANVTFCMTDIFSKSHRAGKIYYLCLFFLYFVIPVFMITLIYAKIFHTLQRTLRGRANRNKAIGKVFKSRRTLAVTMLLIAAVFIAFHAPIFMTFLFLSLGFAVPNDPIFTLVVIEFLPLLNAVFNPFIYCAHSLAFFKRKMISFLGTGLQEPEETQGVHVPRARSLILKSRTTNPAHVWLHACSVSKGETQL